MAKIRPVARRANPHSSGGLYRYPFVKTLTNLTDRAGPPAAFKCP
jgi:hypothetical protein